MNISAPTFFFVPLFFSLVVVFACWIYYMFRHPPPVMSRRSRIYRCVTCGHVYADHRDRPLCQCAKCGAMNEALRR